MRARWPRPLARFPGRFSVASAAGSSAYTTRWRWRTDSPRLECHNQTRAKATQNGFRLSGVRDAVAQMARTLRRVRRVELARRGAAPRAHHDQRIGTALRAGLSR